MAEKPLETRFMPIYAYRCELCGHQQDSLQKLADPHLTLCPACNKDGLKRQLTAAGFQLKGSGWYVTDFRDGGKKSGATATDSAANAAAKTTAPVGSSDTKATPAPAANAPAAAPAPSPSPSPAPSTSTASKNSGNS